MSAVTSEGAAGPLSLDAEDQRRISALEARGWQLASAHPLARLQGLPVGALRLVVLLGPKNNVGARYFQIFGVHVSGKLAQPRIALGMFNSGPFPAFNWVELTHYEPRLAAGETTLDLAREEHELSLFQALSSLVPPGGHLMVEYDSPAHEATARILSQGYPPACSPLGFRLFQVGVRSYRDWYIAEGGREGPRKLQGFKPLNEEIARDRNQSLLRELEVVLAGPRRHDEWGEIARRHAAQVAATLRAGA